MNASAPSSRPDALRRQGTLESAFAVAAALLLFAGEPSGAGVALGGAAALWMAVRGRALVAGAVPLSPAERGELDRLAAGSTAVRELLAPLASAGQAPARFDLERARRLARLASMLDGPA